MEGQSQLWTLFVLFITLNTSLECGWNTGSEMVCCDVLEVSESELAVFMYIDNVLKTSVKQDHD